MAPLQAGTVPPALEREYDPEIKDMATYVHQYKVDSDLAVRNATSPAIGVLGMYSLTIIVH